jgi:hypothetical protein
MVADFQRETPDVSPFPIGEIGDVIVWGIKSEENNRHSI